MIKTLFITREKKREKGEFGYLYYRKLVLGVITLACFFVVLCLFLIGYFVTKTRNNIMTVMAILMVLPSAKFAASFFALLPHQCATEEQYKRVKAFAEDFVFLSDLVITTGQRTLPTFFFVVHNSSVCGYAEWQKYDIVHAEKFLTENLMSNGQKATVKIFTDEKTFLKRLEAMKQVETDEKQNQKDKRIGEILLTLVM